MQPQAGMTATARHAAANGDVPAWVACTSWTIGAAAFALFLIALPRVPIPWGDEIWMASAANSIAHGGSGVPGALPPGPWYASFSHVYGPVFFQLSATFIRLFGLSATTARLAGVTGAALLGAATALLVRAAGGSTRWSAVAFAIMTLTPEVGTIATNGRMDTLAIAWEVAAMAAVAAAFGASHRRQSQIFGAAAGAGWLLAVLTSPRALPLVGGMAIGTSWLLIDRRSCSRVSAVGLWAAAVFVGGGFLWLQHRGVTPIEWAWTYVDSSRSDPQNLLLPGQRRIWGLELRNVITPVIISAAAVLIAFVLAVPGGRGRRDDRVLRDRSTAPAIVALLIATGVNVAFIFSVANNVFTSSSYFVLPLFAAVLAAAVYAGVHQPGRAHVILLFWLAVAALFGTIRIVKYIEVAQTWRDRDPAALERFVDRWVPPGSLVFGYDQYYYYAVEHAGSTFRSWTPTPFPPAAFGRPTGISVEGVPEAALAEKRFLLWPVDGLPGPVPPSFACATPHPIARFSISDSQSTGIERLGGFVSSLHGYPDSMLYHVPADCHP